MKNILAVPFIVILVSFAIGIFLFPESPDYMPSHWNADGEIDGYTPKFWALFLIPFISLAAFFLLVYLPNIDPLKRNIDKFRHHFNGFIIVFTFFLFYIYLLSLFLKADSGLNMVQMMAPGFGVLFYYTGLMLGNAKQNWFVGIRTPWTLTNVKVWDLTHRLAANLFAIAGLISFAGLFAGRYAIYFIVCPAIIFSIYVFFYSYYEYKKMGKYKIKAKLKKI